MPGGPFYTFHPRGGVPWLSRLFGQFYHPTPPGGISACPPALWRIWSLPLVAILWDKVKFNLQRGTFGLTVLSYIEDTKLTRRLIPQFFKNNPADESVLKTKQKSSSTCLNSTEEEQDIDALHACHVRNHKQATLCRSLTDLLIYPAVQGSDSGTVWHTKSSQKLPQLCRAVTLSLTNTLWGSCHPMPIDLLVLPLGKSICLHNSHTVSQQLIVHI